MRPRIKGTRRIVNAARSAWEALRGAPEGRVFRYDPTIDSLGTMLVDYTFKKLKTILANAAAGDIREALELFELMEARDARLYAVANMRRQALTGLEWEVTSAAAKQEQPIDEQAADNAAGYVRDRLDQIKGVDTALEHLATATGSNLVVLELVWEYGELVEIVPIPYWRLTIKADESMDVRVITQEERTWGVPASQPKFVVHIPRPVSGSPLAKCRMAPQAAITLQRILARSDWGAFCEIFGMPLRVGTWPPNAKPAEKKGLIDMLKNLGSRAWAAKSQAMAIEFVESSQRGSAPYKEHIESLNTETAVLWLGGNLPTDTTGGTGTYAAASVQDEGFMRLRDGDIKAESKTVKEQIFGPMVAFKFAGRDMPVPSFRRLVPKDMKTEAEMIRAVQQTGLQVSERWGRAQVDMPEMEPDEPALKPPDAFEDSLREEAGSGFA